MSLDTVKECSEQLYSGGLVLWYYMLFVASRGIATGLSCMFAKKPKSMANWLNFMFSGLDAIGLTVIVIWITTWLNSNEIRECRSSNEDIMAFWQTMLWSIVVLWVYVAFLLLIWILICSCVGIFCCLMRLANG